MVRVRQIAPLLTLVVAACSNAESDRHDIGVRWTQPDATTFFADAADSSDAGVEPDTGSGGGLDATGGHDDTGTTMSDAATSVGDAGTYTNTISGTGPTGTTFNTVGTAFRFVAPGEDRVILFIVSEAISCDDVQAEGWDALLPAGSQILNLESIGSTLGFYTVVQSMNPTAHQAVARYELTGPSPTFGGGMFGSMNISVFGPNMEVGGSFSVTFQGGHALTGTFDATFCPGGVDP